MKKTSIPLLVFFLLACFFISLFFPKPVTAQSGGAGINIDPNNPGGRPSTGDLQALGASWVRFVYDANSGFDYNSYITELNQAGIEVNLVLNQQSLWPGEGVTTQYVNDFSAMAGNLAQQFGSKVNSYEIWNEQDVSGQPTSIYIPPEAYAPLLAATYNAIKANTPNTNVLVGGLITGDPNYVVRIREIIGSIPADGIGLHPYTTDVGQVRQTILNFLAAAPGIPIWITEFGWEVTDQQKQADYLKAVYEIVAQFGSQVPVTMWYAWSDLMNPGFGLLDAAGNPKLAFQYFQLYAALLQAGIPLPTIMPFPFPFPVPSVPPPPPLICSPSSGGGHDSRPFGENDNPDCDTCNQTTKLINSCAGSFDLNDSIEFQRKDWNKCEGEYWWEEGWGGDVIINPEDTEIPFVGKEEKENVKLYLADYLDGTNEYYEDQNHPVYWLDGVNADGVWRKLSPAGYQDQLKKEMINRVRLSKSGQMREGAIHDYNVEYTGRLCWNLPLWGQILATVADKITFGSLDLWKVANRCLYETDPLHTIAAKAIKTYLWTALWNPLNPLNIPYREFSSDKVQLSELGDHLPPDPKDGFLNYLVKSGSWHNSKWARLWSVAPMFSRENTRGEIVPYYGWKEKDDPRNPGEIVEKVPHVARLYEASKTIRQTLIPLYQPNLLAQVNGQSGLITQLPSQFEPDATPNQVGAVLALQDQNISTGQDQPIIAQPAPGSPQPMICEAGWCEGQQINLEIWIDWVDPATNQFKIIVPYGKHISDPMINGVLIGAKEQNCAPLGVKGPICGLYPPGYPRNDANCLYVYSPEWNCGLPELKPGEPLNLTFSATLGDECTITSHCNCQISRNGDTIVTSGDCNQVPPGLPVPPEPTCDLKGGGDVPACSGYAIEDENPNDNLCCDPVPIPLKAVDAMINPEPCDCGACQGTTGSRGGPGCAECADVCLVPIDPCPPGMEETIITREHCEDPLGPFGVDRSWGVALRHPYLREIWENTSKKTTNGLFNFLKPAEFPSFQDIDAKDEIEYDYDDKSDPDGGFVSPDRGDFYYPHLGGVQKAKEWTTTMLMPQKSSFWELMGTIF